jgi:hypothetical protein
VRVLQQAQYEKRNRPPEDLKIISVRKLTKARGTIYAPSGHAKLTAITSGFKPGDRFFDHYDLGALESGDFFPDGRLSRELRESHTRRPQRSPLSRPMPATRVTWLRTRLGQTAKSVSGANVATRRPCRRWPIWLTRPATSIGANCPASSHILRSDHDELFSTSLIRLRAVWRDPARFLFW